MNTFQIEWKQRAAQKNITRYDMAALALTRAIQKDQPFEKASFYLLKSLRPITNQKKIAHGAHPYASLWDAVRHVMNSPMVKFLSEEDQSKLKVLSANIAPRWMEVKLHGIQ